MHPRALIPILVILAAAVIMAGCTGTTPGPAPTPTPGVTVTQTTSTQTPVTTALGSLEPGPTVTMPPRQQVAVDVLRDPVSLNKKITVIFQGGSGQSDTVRVDATITRDDRSTETKYISRPEMGGSIRKGDEVSFFGTDRDRIEVTVWLNTGKSYKIIDQIYQFQTRP